jgi:hypothetical protein
MLAAIALGSAGFASAQHGGGGGMHGGGMGGSMGGGGWHGGSSGGSWHGGGSWNGGGWHGGGSGWHGHTNVVVGFGWGGPWWGWWPAYYPYYSGYYPYSYYPYYYGGYYSAPVYDYGSYVQRPDAGYFEGGDMPPATQAQPQPQLQYYCPNPAGYYPQVQNCSQAWLRVLPQNAPGPGGPTQN